MEIAFLKTHHSLHEGSNTPKQYVERAHEFGIDALAMVDRVSLAGAIEFYKACEDNQILPIFGATLSIYDPVKVGADLIRKNEKLFTALRQYMTAVLGQGIDDDYLLENFEKIEEICLNPFLKLNGSSGKTLGPKVKAVNLLHGHLQEELCSDLKRIEQGKKFLAQRGYLGAQAKKKYRNSDLCSFMPITNGLDGFSIYEYLMQLSQSSKDFSSINSFNSKAHIKEVCLFFSEKIEVAVSNYAQDDVVNSSKTSMSSGNVLNSLIEKLVAVSNKIDKPVDVPAHSSVVESYKGLGSIKGSVTALGNKKFESELSEGRFFTDLSYLVGLFVCQFIGCSDSELGDVPNLKYFEKLSSETEGSIDILLGELFILNLIQISKGAIVPKYALPSSSYSDGVDPEVSMQCSAFRILQCVGSFQGKTEESYSSVVVLAKNDIGYKNLKRLISISFIEGQEAGLVQVKSDRRLVQSPPKTPIQRLREFSDGLLCVIGLRGDEVDKAIAQCGPLELAYDYYADIFGRDSVLIGIEELHLPRSACKSDISNEHKSVSLLELSQKTGGLAFAINKADFLDKQCHEVADIKSAILMNEYKNSTLRKTTFSESHYLKTPYEMDELFSDFEILRVNARGIVEYLGIEQVKLELDNPVLPAFPVPNGDTEESYLRRLSIEGLNNKYKRSSVNESKSPEHFAMYEERLNNELDIIVEMGFEGYFLIVADFIVWGKRNGVPIGYGRGSGAGSLVAYALDITDVDPIKYGLLFERFLNPERVSMPDFDIDFGSGFHPDTGAVVNRESVIKYVQRQYNDPASLFPSVGQIATHGLFGAKSGVKKIAKANFYTTEFGISITDAFPKSPDITIADCLVLPEIEERCRYERGVRETIMLAASLEGLKQNSGVHAGGVVIAPTPLVDYSALSVDIRDPDKVITQFDKDDVERAGLVKFDFLGLMNLTTIEYARKYIKERRGVVLDLNGIDYSDAATYEMLSTGNSHGVFQLESEGMRKLLRKGRFDNMEDLSALLALYRPGPIQSGMVDNFINRKHGKEKISYPDERYEHPSLEAILKPTYGIILYQEQVMQCAQVMANYTLGGADLLRRAMGKKKPEEMAKQRDMFKDGAVKRGIDGDLAMKIFDIIEKFAGYGFNKSHSMSYAHTTFQTAYLKTHYLPEYMSALLTIQSNDAESLKLTLADCLKNDLQLLPPCINKSCIEFKPISDKSIRYGLGAIKGVGHDTIASIIGERDKHGEFKSIRDLRVRCRSFFDKSVAQSLLMAGALDGLECEKELPLSVCDRVVEIKDESLSTADNSIDITLDGIISNGERIKNELKQIWAKYRLLTNRKIDGLALNHGQDVINAFKDIRRMVDELALSSDKDEKHDQVLSRLRDLEKQRAELAGKYRVLQKEKQGSSVTKSESSLTREKRVKGIHVKRAFLWEDINSFVINLTVEQSKRLQKINEAIERVDYSDVVVFDDNYRLKQEMEFVSCYLTGHPFTIDNRHLKLKEQFKYTDISKLNYPNLNGLEGRERNAKLRKVPASRVCGVIMEVRKIVIKKETSKNIGRQMAFLKVNDTTSDMTIMVLPDALEILDKHLLVGEVVVVEGKVVLDEYADDGTLTMSPDRWYNPDNIEDILYETKF